MNTEFKEIGRKSTYKVPDGFFEKVSEKTLLMAKQREQNHRNMIITLRTFAAAASLFAFALIGYFILKPETKQIVQVIYIYITSRVASTYIYIYIYGSTYSYVNISRV